MTITLEICVDSPHGLACAIDGGADRIELCSSLDLGGFTPSPGLIAIAAGAPVPVYMMVRPRAGGFCYSPAEEQAMMADIDAAKQAGLAGIVTGAAHKDGTLDTAMLERLIQQADGLGVTLHRAFDMVPDPLTALQQAIDLGIERILTSGLAPTAMEGLPMLETLSGHTAGKITIMPGSGITAENALHILARTHATEIHASCRAACPEQDLRAVQFGFAAQASRTTSTRKVRDLKQILTARTVK